MDILDGFKLCRNGLHQYPKGIRQCPECKKESTRRWKEQNLDRKRQLNRESARRCRELNPEKYRIKAQLWRQQNLERDSKNKKRWYEQNYDQKRKTAQLWIKNNPEKIREYERRYRIKNPEKRLEIQRKSNKKWAQRNRDKARARHNRYRANKKLATPAWADHSAINAIYAEAVRLEKETGIPHEVDHIYPLQSKYMCGLHVETNLQILTQKENVKKGNRTWPGQLDCQKDPNPLFMRVE